MRDIELRILGPLEIRRGGAPVVLKSRKQRLLLVDLVLHAGDVLSRERLIDDLWTGSPPASVDVTLSSYISTVRSALEPDRKRGSRGTVLVTRESGYMLDTTNVTVDAHEFERLARDAVGREPLEAAAMLEQALALVRGEPLGDLHYEEFATAEARRLTELVLTTRERALDLALDRGEHRAHAAELDQLVRDHPLREGLRAQLMLALYRTGRQADALRVFSEGRQTLVDELGIDPGPALCDLEARILAQDPTLSLDSPPQDRAVPATVERSATPERDPLFGREVEVALAQRLLDDLAEQGRSSVLMVGAPAGMGKSRLVREIVDLAAARGTIATAVGSCLEDAPPMDAWARAMSSYVVDEGTDIFDHLPGRLAREIFRLFPDGASLVGLPRPEPVTDERAALTLVESVTESAVAISNVTPVVCVIEDLHWAGLGTLRVFARLAESGVDGRFLLIGTYRDDALHLTPSLRDTTARIAGKGGVETIRLTGLDAHASHELIESVLGSDVSLADAAALTARTEGNPLYLQELARLSASEAASLDPTVPVSREVADAIRRRIRRLPGDVVELLEVCSFSAGSLYPGVDSIVLAVDDEEVERRFDVAIETGVLEDDPAIAGNLRFTHSLVREALYEAVPSRRRARIHALLGAALEQTTGGRGGNVAAPIARHYARGATAGTLGEGIDWSIRAAREAMAQFAHGEALAHWATAIDLLDRDDAPDPLERARLVLGQGIAARFMQETDLAMSSFLEAFSIGRQLGDHAFMCEVAFEMSEGVGTIAARLWWSPGQTALDALDECLDLIDAEAEPQLVARLLARRAADGVDLAPDDRASLVGRALDLAASAPDESLDCELHAAAIIAEWDVAPAESLRDRVDVGIELGAACDDLGTELQLRRWGAAYALMAGDFADAERRASEASRRAGLSGPDAHMISPTTLRPMLDFIQGRYDAAEQGHLEYLESGVDAAFLEGTHLIGYANLEWHRGNIAAWIDSIVDQVRTSHQPSIVATLALIHVHGDDLAGAKRLIDQLRPSEIAEYGGAAYGGLLPWSLAQVGPALGDEALTRSMYERLAFIEQKLVLPGPGMIPMGVVSQAMARAALFLGDLDATQRHIDDARSLLDRLDAVPWRFQTELVAADLLDARGDRDAATALLEDIRTQALETNTKLAAQLAERALGHRAH